MSALKRQVLRRWAGSIGLSLQAIVALLVLGFAIGRQLGVIALIPNTLPLSNSALFVVAQISFLSIVAAIGILRGRWWAYFLETALIASLLFAAATIEMPFQHNWMIYLPYDVPVARVLNGCFGWGLLGSLAVEIVKIGFRLRLEERSPIAQARFQATTQ